MTKQQSPLDGRVAVVTGAARGLGEAVARELARRGARLALLGLEEEELARVAASLPTTAKHWFVDVTDDDAMRHVADEVRRSLGPPSVVVANAGIAEGGPFDESDPALWRRVIEVNLIGSAITLRSFLPSLTATHGYYLQIASLASIGASPMMSAYCASKAGVESFVHAMGAELAPRATGVGIAYLNWMDTDMIRDADQHAVLRELRSKMPRPARKVHPVDVVAARLANAVERRSPAVYVPAWLSMVQVVRAALPPLVTRLARRSLTRTSFAPTGALGTGGQVAVHRSNFVS
ncbi:SDR family oxidoreductase [Streptomyces sp. NPDC059371]|uniref:SDR family oxidoreductase n=1 Tax=Streptomyces sp. NPDC059371 TaxID=3346812 RepID=UPI003677EF2C